MIEKRALEAYSKGYAGAIAKEVNGKANVEGIVHVEYPKDPTPDLSVYWIDLKKDTFDIPSKFIDNPNYKGCQFFKASGIIHVVKMKVSDRDPVADRYSHAEYILADLYKYDAGVIKMPRNAGYWEEKRGNKCYNIFYRIKKDRRNGRLPGVKVLENVIELLNEMSGNSHAVKLVQADIEKKYLKK